MLLLRCVNKAILLSILDLSTDDISKLPNFLVKDCISVAISPNFWLVSFDLNGAVNLLATLGILIPVETTQPAKKDSGIPSHMLTSSEPLIISATLLDNWATTSEKPSLKPSFKYIPPFCLSPL